MATAARPIEEKTDGKSPVDLMQFLSQRFHLTSPVKVFEVDTNRNGPTVFSVTCGDGEVREGLNIWRVDDYILVRVPSGPDGIHTDAQVPIKEEELSGLEGLGPIWTLKEEEI